MNEVKAAFIEAYRRAADELERASSGHDLSGDFRENAARLEHPDFDAKGALAALAGGLRDRARKVERGDIKQGDWPLFRPEDAASAMRYVERALEIARSGSGNEILLRSIERAVAPLRELVAKYATKTADGWRFSEDSADPVPPFEPPPDPNLRYKK